MPDFDLEAVKARQAAAREAAAHDLDVPDELWAAQQRKTHTDIADCPLCDDDGYRGATVCDHQDRTDTAQRGMHQVREAMGWQQP